VVVILKYSYRLAGLTLKTEMENIQFYQTRLNLKKYGSELSLEFNKTIQLVISKESSLADQFCSSRQIAGHIYSVNQYLIKKIEKLFLLLNEGFVNQKAEYFESDLTLVETMLHVSDFKIKSSEEFQVPVYFSLEELELKLAGQLKKLISLTNHVPSIFANNFKTEIKIMSGIKLDIYEIIFFAMKHSYHHLSQIYKLIQINDMPDLDQLVSN
jgi:hypothetical protein